MSNHEVNYMPNIAFRLMHFVFIIRDIFFPIGKRFEQFNIDKGFVVIDFGCGPGSHIEHASKSVGGEGKVYAIDVHPLAIKAVKEKAARVHLKNVFPVLLTDYPADIDSHSADIIYALDMFHHIKKPAIFLKELYRLLKPTGTLFIESGHQRMDKAKQKILESDCWVINKTTRNMFKCMPKKESKVVMRSHNKANSCAKLNPNHQDKE